MIDDFPADISGLANALIAQRQYTLGLYADLPQEYWQPAQFPYRKNVNPPLWELAHIAWFAELFCLRWRPDDIDGTRTPSCLDVSDTLFNSATVPHAARWTNVYPSRDVCLDFMQRALDSVLAALERSKRDERYPFQLVLAHEDMHAEALAMTVNALGLPLPSILPSRREIDIASHDTHFAGGEIALGSSNRTFRFDNEMPAKFMQVAPFSISSRVLSAGEFAAFRDSAAYADDRWWSEAGRIWKRDASSANGNNEEMFAAMHVNYFQAEAWCSWQGRRLPSEAEWEFAATRSDEFRASTGHVWEWASTAFHSFPGFVAGPYRDYSAPWFGDHQVLRGGSCATHARLKYPQYRNFYTPDRGDMFCGFRSCAIA